MVKRYWRQAVAGLVLMSWLGAALCPMPAKSKCCSSCHQPAKKQIACCREAPPLDKIAIGQEALQQPLIALGPETLSAPSKIAARTGQEPSYAVPRLASRPHSGLSPPLA